jgi:hypothetical protein
MKTLNINKALKRLSNLRDSFRNTIETEFEPVAKDCLTCEVKGSCCTDAHFVNVHITRLEANAIGEALENLDPDVRKRVISRNRTAVSSLGKEAVSSGFSVKFSCPLFEPGVGCLVHSTAKPLPCINHACYERESDLPPSELLSEAEEKISRLNDRVFRKNWNWLPIPIWIERILKS